MVANTVPSLKCLKNTFIQKIYSNQICISLPVFYNVILLFSGINRRYKNQPKKYLGLSSKLDHSILKLIILYFIKDYL